MSNNLQTPQNSKLAIQLNELGSVENELKKLATHCLSLQILGQEDKEGYKVARAQLTNLVSKRTGIDKAAKPYFDLVKEWKTKGESKVLDLKGLISNAESHLRLIVDDWKTKDDLRKAKEKAAREKLIKERTELLENAGATLKNGFFILDEISISLETIKKQKEDRFEIIVEEFKEKNELLIKLAEQRLAQIVEIDPKAKANFNTLKSQTDEEFQEYKELVQLRVEKKKIDAAQKVELPSPVLMDTGFRAALTGINDGKKETISDIEEIPQELEDPKELLGRWFSEISNTCSQDLELYKSPEREILKNCKKDIITAFSKAFAEMKKIEQLNAA